MAGPTSTKHLSGRGTQQRTTYGNTVRIMHPLRSRRMLSVLPRQPQGRSHARPISTTAEISIRRRLTRL
jgi:hypothetical protein